MAIGFNRQPGAGQAAPVQQSTQMMEVQPFDIMQDKEDIVQSLMNSEEIDKLTSTIDINDPESIVTFGAKSAEEISKASDVVLRSVNMSQLDESSKMLTSLAKIMDQFDINEIKDNPSMFGKIFGNVRKQLDKILAKYNTMGDEVDKIYVQLKQYETDIKQTNNYLEQMFKSNVAYFHELEKYIVAGDQGCAEIAAYVTQLQQEMDQSGDMSISFEIQSVQQAQLMLEQRTQDLRTAENVALQSIPMIKMMQFSNMNLVRKINSAFIITLPVFKQALAQAIMLKRQRIQADALSALDERTNEMLIKNARNTAEQSKITTRLAAGSSIKTETLENTWRTIMNGIEETQRIQENAREERERDKESLQKIKGEFVERFGNGQRK